MVARATYIVGESTGLIKHLKAGMKVLHVDAGKEKLTIIREDGEEDKDQLEPRAS